MSANLIICQLVSEARDKSKKFKLRKEKTTAAIVFKIDPEKQLVEVDEEYDDISLDALREELPSHQPRYVLYSHVLKHDDGRISYPMVFIYISPQGSKPELQMLYAGSKNSMVRDVEATKVFELRSVEEMTEEWLTGKLKFFR